jgi:predicted Fe-Mo cluster-binding NifX family protein
VADGLLATHFGHCQEFALYEVLDNHIQSVETITPPAHAPGVLPKFIADQGVTHVIAGGMGTRAQQLFEQQGIQVIVGASGQPEQIARDFLSGQLEMSNNPCDH